MPRKKSTLPESPKKDLSQSHYKRSSARGSSNSKSPIQTRSRSIKQTDNITKVINNCIERNEERMNIAQKSLFSALINEEIMNISTGLYEKLNRAVQTYNDRLKKEIVNHVNLKLKIACIERGVFTEGDFDKNLVCVMFVISIGTQYYHT
jgi:hypothetical protein